MANRWIFLLFLLIAAGQDMKRKSVEIRVYIVFWVWAWIALGYRQIAVGEHVDWGMMLSGMCPGLGLIGCGLLWRNAIGIGDGCFFLVSGLLLGFWENLELLCYGLLLCGVYCLGYLAWNQIRHHRNVRNYTVPFLPFLVPVGIWIVCR